MQELRVITHNIAGGYLNFGAVDALYAVMDQINAWLPDVVGLQEVCQQQADAFAAAYPDWYVEYTNMSDTKDNCGGAAQGELLASPHQMTDVKRRDLGWPQSTRTFHLTHANIAMGGDIGVARVGTTHIRAKYGVETDDEVQQMRLEQIRRIAYTMETYKAAGQVCSVFGDFNVGVTNPALNSLDFVDGQGEFKEADRADNAPTLGESKIDHCWLSINRLDSVSGGVVNSPTSDHRILRGIGNYRPKATTTTTTTAKMG